VADLIRILVLVPLAYIAALIAASLVVTVALFGGTIDAETLPFAAGVAVGIVLFAGMLSFVPALIAVILGEIFRWRSLVAWLAAGGVIGLICAEATIAYDGLAFAEHLQLICVAGGFVGGAVYWFIAGKLAGTGNLTSRA
jgi:hypothetical protein